MRVIVKEVEDTLRSFVNSTHHRALVIDCAPEHSPLLLKTIEAIEDDPAVPDIFLTFGHAFERADDYVGRVLVSLREQITQVNQQLTSRGDPPLRDIPPDVEDARLLPESRLVKALEHLRSVVPRGRQLVWLFYPLELDESQQGLDEYHQIVATLIERIKDVSIRASKVIVRDSSAHTLIRSFRENPDVRFYVPPLDPESIKTRLNQAANDPKTPPHEQAQMHMMLAGIDVSGGNFDRALSRNTELLGYFYHTGQRTHQSIALNNIGDIHYMQGRYDLAQQSYEQAISIAAVEGSQPLVTYQSINLGNSLMLQQRHQEALSYYAAAEQLAEVNKSVPYQVQAIERIGEVNQAMGNTREAASSWQRAADLCSKFRYDQGLRPLLDRLLGVYKELGDTDRLNACRKALADLVRRQT